MFNKNSVIHSENYSLSIIRIKNLYLRCVYSVLFVKVCLGVITVFHCLTRGIHLAEVANSIIFLYIYLALPFNPFRVQLPSTSYLS